MTLIKLKSVQQTGLIVAALACMVPAANVAAQEDTTSIDSGGLEEIIVTAQRREQSLQDIGVAVSVFSGDDVRDMRITRARDLARHTPSLSIAQAQSDSVPIFAIRGVGLDDYNINNSSSVAIYVDDVFASSPAFLNFQLMDIKAVEVIRGPQGTLFGKNATGGAITFTSNRPTEEFESSVLASYGRFDEVKVEGYISGAFSEQVRGRLALSTLQGGEYQTDINTGAGYGDLDKAAVRGMLEFDLSDTVTGLWNIHAGQDKSTPTVTVIADDVGGLVAFGLEGGSFADGFHTARDVEAGFVPLHDNSGWGSSLTIDAELPYGTLTSITAYGEEDVLIADSYDGRASFYGDLQSDIILEQFSQELRLTSKSDGPFTWVAGLIYTNEEQDGRQNAVPLGDTITLLDIIFAAGLGPVVEREAAVDTQYDQEIESLGAYFHSETQLNDQFKLTAGLRYSSDEVTYSADVIDFTAFNDGFGGFIAATNLFFNGTIIPTTAPVDGVGVSMGGVGGPGQDPGKHDDNNVSGKVGLDYQPNDDLLLYASAATGYKGGRFYSGPVANSTYLFYVRPEELTAYELGFKSTLADGRFRLNGSAFFYDYEDRQSFILDELNAVVLANIPKSELRGVELEFVLAPTSNLDIRGGVTWLDAEVIDPPTPSDLNGIVPAGSIVNGSPLSQAPELSYSLMARYSWALSDRLDGRFVVDYSHKDEQLASVSDPSSMYGSIKDLGARFALASNDGNWEVALWGRNLADNDGFTFAQTTFAGESMKFVQRPRTYGIEFVYTWH